MFDDTKTLAKYFYQSDHLHDIFKNNHMAIENTIHALEKLTLLIRMSIFQHVVFD
jgi:hypothetical protein